MLLALHVLGAALHDLGGCQNSGPFWGPYYNTAPIIYGPQKGTLILTTTHLGARLVLSRVLIGGTPFRVLITLLITYFLSPLPLQVNPKPYRSLKGTL